MENATDALKIAFAVFIFVIAITVTFSLISQAKSTADDMLYYSDKTNYYNYAENAEHNREVSVTEVIATLYRYYKESLSVTIITPDDNEVEFDLRNAPLTIGQIEQQLETYINGTLIEDWANVRFREEFTEVPISGMYDTGEDGTQIVEASGEKKVYITYRYIQ